MIQTGFSVMTPISFTMWGWSNWRMVTVRNTRGRSQTIPQKETFFKNYLEGTMILLLWGQHLTCFLEKFFPDTVWCWVFARLHCHRQSWVLLQETHPNKQNQHHFNTNTHHIHCLLHRSHNQTLNSLQFSLKGLYNKYCYLLNLFYKTIPLCFSGTNALTVLCVVTVIWLNQFSLSWKWVCRESTREQRQQTYRADVNSLVDVSELTLAYAASQLDTIPLNLIVPRWMHKINTNTHTDENEQSKPSDQNIHRLMSTHWACINQACQSTL